MVTSRGILSGIGKVAAVTLANKGSGFLFLIVSSRILSPLEFGVMAAAQIIIQFAALVSHGGIGATLIQRPTLNSHETRVALLLSCGLASLAYLFIALSAGASAAFVKIEQLQELIPFLGLTVLASGGVNISSSLLQRDGKADRVSYIEFAGAVIGTWGVALPTMLAGASYWSLAYGQLTTAVISLIGLHALARAPVVPRWKWSTAKSLMKKGIGYFTARFLNFVSLQIDYVVVGRAFGAESLGHYSRSYRLMNYVSQIYVLAVNRIVFPALASIQDNHERFRRGILRGFSISFLVAGPLSIFLMIAAQDIVYVLLGDSWAVTAQLLAILGPFAIFRIGSQVCMMFFMARGDVRLLSFHEAVYTSLLVVSLLVAAQINLKAIAWSVGLSTVIHFCLLIIRVQRRIHATKNEVMDCLTVPIILSVLTLASTLFVQLTFANSTHTIKLLLEALMTAICFVTIFAVLPSKVMGPHSVFVRDQFKKIATKLGPRPD